MVQGFIGIVFFIALGWLLSENKTAINWRSTLLTLFIQISLALIILKVPFVQNIFLMVGRAVMAVKNATLAGTSFVFGYIGGGNLPFDVKNPQNLFAFAFQALPMIIVVSALSMLLFYWRVLPFIVKHLSKVIEKVLGLGGAVGVCGAANIFLGQTESPLLIRPYLRDLSRSELLTVMSLGMATTSGTIIAIYADILSPIVPNALSHLLTCSVISVPAAILISRLMVPQQGAATSGQMVMPFHLTSATDAIAKGTADGLNLFLAIIAMLIVFIAMVALVNKGLYYLPHFEGEPFTLQRILGFLLAPLAWLMGIPWSEAITAASLLGTKTILNEIYAFIEMVKLPENTLSLPSRIMMTYALCGFANLSSIGIVIGGLGGLVPERRQDIIALGFKAVIAGTLATILSGTVVGILLHFTGL